MKNGPVCSHCGETVDFVWPIKEPGDKYYHNIYISRVGKRLCGVIKIKDGSEALGLEYLSRLMKNLKNMEI